MIDLVVRCQRLQFAAVGGEDGAAGELAQDADAVAPRQRFERRVVAVDDDAGAGARAPRLVAKQIVREAGAMFGCRAAQSERGTGNESSDDGYSEPYRS